jgi:dihydroflavonol-4-reductase
MSSQNIVLVTGATGFIGRHTVRVLCQAGHKVRALCRSESKDLQDEGVEVVRGDVLDVESLKAAVQGVDSVIHGAGAVSRSKEDTAWMMRVHVTGTRFVAAAASEAGVRRLVHLSTSGTVAVGNDAGVVYHEDDPVPLGSIHRWPYYLSKWLSERAARDTARLLGDTLEVVMLNPSLVLGPGDTRGSSTTDVQRFLNREIPIVPSGGFSFVDARDVAEVAVRCLEAGRPGERYLLGAVNLSCSEFFRRLEEVSGVKGPLVPIALPRFVSRLGVSLLERAAKTVGAKLPISEIEADMASSYWYVDSRKAKDELGFEPRDPMQTLLDTVRDLRGQRVGERFVGRA